MARHSCEAATAGWFELPPLRQYALAGLNLRIINAKLGKNALVRVSPVMDSGLVRLAGAALAWGA